MGKLSEFQLGIEETLNDLAVEMSYNIQDAIDQIQEDTMDEMRLRVEDIMEEYDLGPEDMDALGLDLDDMMMMAIDDNRDW